MDFPDRLGCDTGLLTFFHLCGQGLEINRSMLEKKKEDPTDRYFSSAGFAGLKK